MQNPSLARSLRSLSHPASISAVLLLLVNDHVLRWTWPAWWTGKLGDFTWLVFFPFIIAAVLAWLLPSQWADRERIVAGVSFGITGIGFALMNTVPTVHRAGTWLLGRITGAPFTLLLDPTDLLTLPGLVIGWWIWRQSGMQRERSKSNGWAMLVLGALATVATSPPPEDYGITNLVQKDDGTVVAIAATFEGYLPDVSFSSDGGLSWWTERSRDFKDFESIEPFFDCATTFGEGYCGPVVWELANPSEEELHFRFLRGRTIELSSDGGETWKLEFDLQWTEARRIYYRENGALFYLEPGPLDGIFHQPTGNLILAMGHEGVLVRSTDGEWQWAEVGPYSRADFKAVSQLARLLTHELAAAAFLMSLGIVSMISLANAGAKNFEQILRMFCWLGWMIGVALAIPGQRDYLAPDFSVFVGATCIILLLLWIGILANRLGNSGRILKEAWVYPILAGGLYLLPFGLWSQGGIARYVTALVFSLALAAASLYAGWRLLSRTTSD